MIELFLPDVEILLQDHAAEIHEEPEYPHLPDDGHEHVWLEMREGGSSWLKCVLCGKE